MLRRVEEPESDSVVHGCISGLDTQVTEGRGGLTL